MINKNPCFTITNIGKAGCQFYYYYFN